MSTDLDDDGDGPPVFCPKCEAKGLVCDVEWVAHSEYSCENPDCDYLWTCIPNGYGSEGAL